MTMENHSDRALQILRRLIEEPGAAPSAEEEAILEAAFPYMALPAALRLKSAPEDADADERRRLALRVAVSAPGRDTLFCLLDPDGDLLKSFMPPEEKAKPTAANTDDAIDTFLDTYGRMDSREEALLEKLIFNPVPDDYAALLARESGTPEKSVPDQAPAPGDTRGAAQDRLLDAFLETASSEPSSPEPPAEGPVQAESRAAQPDGSRHHPDSRTAPVPPPSTSLSESLAQVYIRRGRYDKAFDIIHALSLNNPKKSVYFADQLRFLQKLMLNERLRNAATESDNNM